MPSLTFYRQARVDGGVRTGIDVDGYKAWEAFEPGMSEDDPALLWYIDVRCEGDELPMDSEAARDWYRSQAPLIKAALQQLSVKLGVGFDDLFYPYQFPVSGTSGGTSMTIVCSSVRGLEVGTIGKVLRETGENWERTLDSMTAAEVSVA